MSLHQTLQNSTPKIRTEDSRAARRWLKDSYNEGFTSGSTSAPLPGFIQSRDASLLQEIVSQLAEADTFATAMKDIAERLGCSSEMLCLIDGSDVQRQWRPVHLRHYRSLSLPALDAAVVSIPDVDRDVRRKAWSVQGETEAAHQMDGLLCQFFSHVLDLERGLVFTRQGWAKRQAISVSSMILLPAPIAVHRHEVETALGSQIHAVRVHSGMIRTGNERGVVLWPEGILTLWSRAPFLAFFHAPVRGKRAPFLYSTLARCVVPCETPGAWLVEQCTMLGLDPVEACAPVGHVSRWNATKTAHWRGDFKRFDAEIKRIETALVGVRVTGLCKDYLFAPSARHQGCCELDRRAHPTLPSRVALALGDPADGQVLLFDRGSLEQWAREPDHRGFLRAATHDLAHQITNAMGASGPVTDLHPAAWIFCAGLLWTYLTGDPDLPYWSCFSTTVAPNERIFLQEAFDHSTSAVHRNPFAITPNELQLWVAECLISYMLRRQ